MQEVQEMQDKKNPNNSEKEQDGAQASSDAATTEMRVQEQKMQQKKKKKRKQDTSEATLKRKHSPTEEKDNHMKPNVIKDPADEGVRVLPPTKQRTPS